MMGKGASAVLTYLGRLCRHAQGGPWTLEGVSKEGPAVMFHFRLLYLCVFYLRAMSLTALCLQHPKYLPLHVSRHTVGLLRNKEAHGAGDERVTFLQ